MRGTALLLQLNVTKQGTQSRSNASGAGLLAAGGGCLAAGCLVSLLPPAGLCEPLFLPELQHGSFC